MKNKLFLQLFVVFLFALSANAQDIILWEKVSHNTEKPKKGINSTSFNHFYVAWGVNTAFLNNETSVKVPASNDYTFGYRQIFRLNNNLAFGFKGQLVKSRFSVTQNADKNVHDSVLHKKEIFLINHVDASLYLRINFDRHRGAYMGHFLDIGAWGGYNFMRQRMIEDITVDKSKTRIWHKGVGYIEKYQYGAYAAIGLNRFLFYARYRVSDLFDPCKKFSQLPALTFGLEVGLHK